MEKDLEIRIVQAIDNLTYYLRCVIEEIRYQHEESRKEEEILKISYEELSEMHHELMGIKKILSEG